MEHQLHGFTTLTADYGEILLRFAVTEMEMIENFMIGESWNP